VSLALLQVNVITFQKRALKALFHSPFDILFYCSSSQTLSATFLLSFAFSLFNHPDTQKVWFFLFNASFPLLHYSYNCLRLFTFSAFLCSSSSLLYFPLSELLAWGRVFLGFSLPLSALTPSAKPFSFLPSSAFSSNYGAYKNDIQPSTPKVNYRALYPWAPDELLDEYSSLVSTKAWRDHVGKSNVYDHRAFAKRHDEDIAVLPCTLGEPVCGDEWANNGVPFFYFY